MLNRRGKTLIVTYEFPPIIGGAGVYSHDLAIGFALNNWEVDIVTYRSNIDDIKQNLKEKYNINVFDFKAKQNFHFLQFFLIIKRLTNTHKYDLIILSDGRAKRVFSLFMPFLRREIEISISIFHGNEIDSFFIKPSKAIKFLKLDKKLLTLFSLQMKLVTVSRNEEKLWHNFLPNLKDKIIMVRHGINADMFYPRTTEQIVELKSNLNIPLEKKIILSASRLVEKKGQDKLLQSFSELIKKQNNLLLLIVGDGDYSETLKELSNSLGTSESVRFVGGLDRRGLSEYYSISDLFVLVSRYHESFGLVYLEAAACGVPSISGNLGGVRDAVVDQITGFIVDSYDTDELLDKMLFMIENEKKRKEMGGNALDRFQQEFTSKAMAYNLIKLVL